MLEKMKKKFKFLKWLVVVPCALLSCVLLGAWTPGNEFYSNENYLNSYSWSYSNWSDEDFCFVNDIYFDTPTYLNVDFDFVEDYIQNHDISFDITYTNPIVLTDWIFYLQHLEDYYEYDDFSIDLNNFSVTLYDTYDSYVLVNANGDGGFHYYINDGTLSNIYKLHISFNIDIDFINILNSYNVTIFLPISLTSVYDCLTPLNWDNLIVSPNTYSTYVSNHRYTNTQYNNLLNQYNTLNNNYTDLQSQYTNLDSQYQSLLSSYVDLENDYSLLNTQFETLDSQFQDLSSRYNALNTQYQELLVSYNSIQSSVGIDTSQYTLKLGSVPSQNSIDFTPQLTLTTNDYLNASGYLDMYSIYEDYIDSQTYGTVLEVTCPVSNVYNKDLIYTFVGQPSARINLSLNVNGEYYVKSYELDNVNPELNTGFSLLSNISYDASISSADWSYCTYTKFYVVYTNRGNHITSIQIGSNNGFNSGYLSGVDSQKSIINDLQIQLEDLQDEFDTLQTTYNALNTNYLILQNQYNEIANSDIQLNFSTLIWNIASTPFEAFKTMWNFNFLGFNIYQFVSR